MNALKELESIPLSDSDIYNKLRGKTNIVLYRDLNKIKDIDQLLKNDSAVILYEKSPKNGHWICLIRYMNHGKPTIEFFDSYGMFPESQKKFINNTFLKDSQQAFNKIADLLYKAMDRYVVEYNDHKLQKWSPEIATCGPHVVARILMKDKPLAEYNKFLNSFKDKGLTPDDVVTVIANNL